MHLTSEEIAALIGAAVALAGAAAAWLRARAAHQAAAAADKKATRALNGLRGGADGGQPGSGTPSA